MKCYHDNIRGFQDCPGDACLLGFKSFGSQCNLSEVHWLPRQIKAVANEINDLEFKKRELEERLEEVSGE